MKSTPKITANGTSSAHNNTNGAGHTSKPGQIVSVADLIRDAKAKNPDRDGGPAIKEPTTYPATPEPENLQPATETPEPAPATAPEAPAPEPTTQAAPEPAAPTPEPAPAPVVPALSRTEQVEYWNEKARKISLINSQLTNLKAKHNQLKDFSFTAERTEDHRYARISILDDANVEFQCKTNGLIAIVVEHLKELFARKIEEKENELLMVASA